MEADFTIDRLSKSIEDSVTGKSYETEVNPLEKTDLKIILKKSGWRFNWKVESSHSNRQLYKLIIKGDQIIQGLISLEPMDGYVEMHLIESAPHNIGRRKHYLGVAGNLVAFICKVSFDSGLQGFVAFTPKTELIHHYREALGAELIYKNRMAIATIPARKLVNSYYEGYFRT